MDLGKIKEECKGADLWELECAFKYIKSAVMRKKLAIKKDKERNWEKTHMGLLDTVPRKHIQGGLRDKEDI
jgi:hypothetical protein